MFGVIPVAGCLISKIFENRSKTGCISCNRSSYSIIYSYKCIYFTRKIQLICTILILFTIYIIYYVEGGTMGRARGGKYSKKWVLMYPVAAHRPFGCARAPKKESGTTCQTIPTTTNNPQHRLLSTLCSHHQQRPHRLAQKHPHLNWMTAKWAQTTS
jgi:hypothetical protein